MRISKAFITILFLGLFIIAGVLLYMLWQDELDRRDAQEASLTSTQALLPPIQANVAAAQADLTAAQAKLAAARESLAEWQAVWPTPPPVAAIQTIDYGAKLFILAANNQLNLVEFRGNEPSAVTIGGIKYQSTDMEIKVSGAILKINDFIGNLETSDPYLTATIDAVNITFYTEFDPEIGGVPLPDALITINILALER
ncbi:hypothetical protein [Dehalogenimonas alkenigignens]|uniref:hypothetical protein n=1 Tax=Dehalogenimonas alkenigignens TaxID=1217799 RepID=UPI000D56FBB0|nr:hypothetical protein [Dehalogenimonas alkenigignens]PVV84402.1 hypothetical protein DD509_03670 [Dehalogenimonas alkenigignens]